ncbi:lipocalin [Mucilaginibacter corticis]|uniref:Lipocalin n=1 Tax=Mucilaginibacter corticis TaxID=2597670 RepID=A0A556MV01_9SPHI|nr:lipocalin family protein [Mucilaginibacter corticis]TSJ43693.1 lipocalin [Mucilaginibacter corticis]
MKKEKLVIAMAAGIGVAAIVYKLFSDEIPDGAIPVQGFDIENYMGLWYEIARLPNHAVKHMGQLTEHYALNSDGTVNVITKGYDIKKDKWVETSGKLKFVDGEELGMFKVSYSPPFYSSYNVIDIDPEYKYALVCGSNLDQLRILSKETNIPDEIRAQFVVMARMLGFDIRRLQWMNI